MTSKNYRVRSLAYRAKVRKQWYQAIAEKGSNCNNTSLWPWFSGDTLPSDDEARELCAGCPLLDKECLTYAQTGDMMWGVVNGEVRGRGTAEEGGLEDV